MQNEFTPMYQKTAKDKAFNTWEMEKPSAPTEAEEVISAAEVLAAEQVRIREESEAAGYQAGLQRAQADIEALRQQLEQALLVLQQPIRLVDEQLVSDMLKTMLWLCEACIGIEINQQSDKLQAILSTLIAQWTEIAGHKSLMLNPVDLDWIKGQLKSSRHQDLIDNMHADESLKRGDFYIKSEHMELDGRLHSRLSQLFAEYL